MSRAQARAWSALFALLGLNWAWQTHPVWTVAGAVLAVAVGAWLARRRWAVLHRPEPTWLYQHFFADGEQLYYGISNDYPARCSQHAAGSWWWCYVDPSRSTVQGPFPTRLAALRAETAAIRADCPIGNERHNPMFWAQQPRRLQLQAEAARLAYERNAA